MFTVCFFVEMGPSVPIVRDCAGSTLVEPTISSHVELEGSARFFFIGAVSLGGGLLPPLTGLFELT